MPVALVIDDHRLAADTLSQMLELLGMQVKVAYGPRAAMVELRNFTPQIVFLDINMPGVDGFEVLAYLRRMPHMGEVPVVVVTSDDQPETQMRAKEMGVLEMIYKPASIDALEKALQKAGLL